MLYKQKRISGFICTNKWEIPKTEHNLIQFYQNKLVLLDSYKVYRISLDLSKEGRTTSISKATSSVTIILRISSREIKYNWKIFCFITFHDNYDIIIVFNLEIIWYFLSLNELNKYSTSLEMYKFHLGCANNMSCYSI